MAVEVVVATGIASVVLAVVADIVATLAPASSQINGTMGLGSFPCVWAGF